MLGKGKQNINITQIYLKISLVIAKSFLNQRVFRSLNRNFATSKWLDYHR